MKSVLFAFALALPVPLAATVAMDSQQATSAAHDEAAAHRQLFTVKFVLRPAPRDPAPPAIIMDDATPQIVPPPPGSIAAALLGALPRDPNTTVCYGWGCESMWR
jgi:hypothetical protein